MASKRGRLTRGSSSRASLTPHAHTFPSLKFLSEAHAEKYLKLVDYHIVRERAFACEDLQGFGEVMEMLQQRHWCLGLLSLLMGEPINFGCLIFENIKYMANAAQRAYGHFYVINEICRRVGVPVYPEDEMISPKSPLKASIIRRLEAGTYASCRSCSS
ncbi:hypothetical protein KIW84_073398 [Lathyrus oleraceus]|uniref:Uncharacterized protein n=1 Tax=Pisum sativum TaxID=3888 RepID=A0A9D4ZXA5_PEA|nr:hypothetical protein KIW84_073398 [Pisum sativum]